MLKYSKTALLALPRLFAYRNEIDIFTEDNLEDKEFYRVLFERLFERSRKKVKDITPLGSRRNVIEAHGKSASSKRKSIYIVDGDITIILGENTSEHKNLLYLDRYCIENYVFCEEAAIELAHLIAYKKSKGQVKNDINFSSYYSIFIQPIIDLYFSFALCRKYGVGEEFTTLPHFFGLKNTIRIENIVNRKDEILKEIESALNAQGKNGKEIVNLEIDELKIKWPYTFKTFLKIVSGKDYLLHMLKIQISEAAGGKSVRLGKDEFKLFLAGKCNISSLNYIKRAIESI